MTTEPPASPPVDDKDWTWVLDRPCPDCGVAVADLEVAEIPRLAREVAARFAAAVVDPGAGERTDPLAWSVLENACHVRDVFDLADVRLGRMLQEDDPTFANWDQDDTAIAERYHLQDRATVATDVVAAAERAAARFESVGDDAWQRPGRRSDGAGFTVESFARYLIHDPLHHLWDVGIELPT